MRINIFIIIILALLCVNATRCSNTDGGDGNILGGSKLKLTPQWTNNMRVSFYAGGGMLNEYTRYEIYTDSASFTLHEDQVTNVYKLKFTKVELDSIAKIFYDNKFESLRETKHEVIHDMATRSITVWKGNESVEKGSSATGSFKGEDGKALNKIQNDVMGFVYRKFIAQKKETIHIVFDQSFTKTKYDYRLQFAPTNEVYDSKTDGRLNEIEKALPAGKYNVNIYSYIAIPNKGTKYGPNGYLTFSTTEFNKLVVTLTKDSAIVITPSRK